MNDILAAIGILALGALFGMVVMVIKAKMGGQPILDEAPSELTADELERQRLLAIHWEARRKRNREAEFRNKDNLLKVYQKRKIDALLRGDMDDLRSIDKRIAEIEANDGK